MTVEKNNQSNKQATCFKCGHYYITWDEKRPKGCKYFGFKTPEWPCHQVKMASGEICRAFIEKKKIKKES